MKLHRFTASGLHALEQHLDNLANVGAGFDEQFLTDSTLTEVVIPQVEVERRHFGTRLEMASYLHERLTSVSIHEPEQDKGLWAWLSAFWLEVLAPTGRDGKRKPGERARWIPAIDKSRRYYRHLVLGPYAIFRRHLDDPENARVLLTQEPHRPGDVVEQLASRQDLVNCPAVLGAATLLYCDETGGIKRGAGGKSPGSARRLSEVLLQFDLTYDLHSMTAKELFDLLPQEFRRWAVRADSNS